MTTSCKIHLPIYGLSAFFDTKSTSANVPDGWGYIQYESAANPTPDVPEGIGMIAMLMVSSVAAAGIVFLRKRQKIAHL